jgi:LuxR family maltose regulon positive regulatory protein
VSAAWIALVVGNVADVHRFTAALARTGDEVLPDGTPVRAQRALLDALTATAFTELRERAACALAEHAAGSPYRAIAAHLEATARRLGGDVVGARQRADEAVRYGTLNLVPGQLHGLAERARIELGEGMLDEAQRSVDAAIDLIESHSWAHRPAFGLVYSIAALVHLRCGRAEPADRERQHARALLQRLEDVTPLHVLESLLELADAAVHLGDRDVAIELLDEAGRRLRWILDAGVLFERRQQLEATVARGVRVTEVGAPTQQLSPAELRVLDWLPTHLTFAEIAEELFVSRNTAKTHALAIYRKLGATSRGAAVKEAQALGLLE